MDILELLQRLRSGDAEAIQELIRTHQAEMFRLALSILDDPADAEDITQDAFMAALGAIDTYRGDSAFKTWLFSITVNLCRQRWRQRKARERLQQVLQAVSPFTGASPVQPEASLLARENQAELWQTVNGLGEKYQIPVVLFYEHELPVSEIAQILNIPVGTVLSRLHTARERLAVMLRREVDDEDMNYESNFS